jgi:predicted DCC family thiol-disulfide oxidoreductase YuxK
VNTEITENVKVNGWVLYDADCHLCTGLARHFQGLLAGRRLALLPLQTPWVKARRHLPDTQLLAEMRLLRPDGTYAGGADALLEISRLFWWAWPLGQMGRVPAIAKMVRAGYRWIARNRNCAGGGCEVKSPANQSRLLDVLPLIVLPLLAVAFKGRVAPWVFMWAMAFALYAGCKWLTYRQARRHGLTPGLLRVLIYLLAWPGMDAANFLDEKKTPARPQKMEWVLAVLKMGFGLILVWKIARCLLPVYPMIAGWAGMMGVVFILHFGLFHIFSLLWRQAGMKATLLMQNPIRATSLTEFWGRRWNTAFNELAFRFTFLPFRRLTTATMATLLVFGLSGLIHELVISLPARGGYGLPTLYFLIQGFGTLTERSQFGRGLGLGRGTRGWFFTLWLTVAPMILLFPPPFIKNVILPMLAAIGAT